MLGLPTVVLAITYEGIIMRGVPATDAFVTVSVDLSPSDYAAHAIDAAGAATLVHDSPCRGDLLETDAFAFDGAPTKRLLTLEGIQLRIDGPDCTPDASRTGCSLKDGNVGTIWDGQGFVAMVNSAVGQRDGRFGDVGSGGAEARGGRPTGADARLLAPLARAS